MKKKALIVVVLLILLILLLFWSIIYYRILKPDGQYREAEKIQKSGTLIGLTVDECKKVLGAYPQLFEEERELSFYAGYMYANTKRMGRHSDYLLTVYFDENNRAVRSELKYWP